MSLASAKNRFLKYEHMYRKNQKESEWMPYFDERLRWFSNSDPTPQKKYIDWMMKVTIEHASEKKESLFNMSHIANTMAHLIPWFHDNSQRLGDIYRFTLSQLVQERNTHIECKKTDRLGISKLEQGKDYEVLLDDTKLVVFRPLNYKASRMIGGNDIGKRFAVENNMVLVSQTWCTTTNPQHFERYTKIEANLKQRLFYVMDVENNEKWAVHIYHRNDCKSTIGKGKFQCVNFYNAADMVTITWGGGKKERTSIEKSFLEKVGVRKLIDEQLKELAK